MKKHLLFTLFIYIAFGLQQTAAQPKATGTGSTSACPVYQVRSEQLPDMHTPRSGHYTFCVNGEITVFGGHTSGFVPTPTAEYFRNGQWHEMNMVYSHDEGVAIPMKSGQIMIGGGHEQHLGIGQTFPVELYDPLQHRFSGYGCLDKKRVFAEGIEMDSGRIVIAGNWYADDGIEEYNGHNIFSNIKDLPETRSEPYILRTSKDNAMIFSRTDGRFKDFDTIKIVRLKGDDFTVPLFSEWRPHNILYQNSSQHYFIGDEQQGIYSYLVPVFNDKGRLAIAKTDGEAIALLPTTCDIPMEGPFGGINYFSHIVADRKAGQAYIVGSGQAKDDSRLYILSIAYKESPARLKLYYTEPLPVVLCTQPILNDDGDMILAGGLDFTINNFKPYATTYLIHLSNQQACGSVSSWIWYAAGGLLLFALMAVIIMRRKAAKVQESAHVQETADSEQLNTQSDAENCEGADPLLMERISQLMEQQQLYLQADVKLTDVASRLNTNRLYVSNCINHYKGCSFSAFVNNYRIGHAQQLMREQPDMKYAEVCAVSGFSHETTFYRTFKSVTGMTPKEWKATIIPPEASAE